MSEIASAFVRLRPDFTGFKTQVLSDAEKQLKQFQTSVTDTEDAVKKAARENISSGIAQRESLTKLKDEYASIAKNATRGSDVQVEANKRAAEAARQLGVAYHEAGTNASGGFALFRKSSSEARSEEDKLTRGAIAGSGALRSMGRSLAFASGAFVGAAGFVSALKSSITGAAALQGQIGRTNDVFGSSAKSVLDWSKTSVQSMGLSRAAALNAADTFGTFFHNVGQSTQGAAQMGDQFTKLAVDMAAYKRVDPSLAIDALGSALRGRTMELKQFGVVISQADIAAEAMSLGIVKSTVSAADLAVAQDKVAIAQAKLTDAQKNYGQGSTQVRAAEDAVTLAEDALQKKLGGTTPKLTDQQKAMAMYALILRETKTEQGAFAKNQGDAGEVMQKFHASVQQLEAAVGTGLLPVFSQYATALTNWMSKGADSQKVTDDAHKAAHYFAEAISGVIAVLKVAWGIFQTFSDAVGGTKHAVELLTAAVAYLKLRPLINDFSELATTMKTNVLTAFDNAKGAMQETAAAAGTTATSGAAGAVGNLKTSMQETAAAAGESMTAGAAGAVGNVDKSVKTVAEDIGAAEGAGALGRLNLFKAGLIGLSKMGPIPVLIALSFVPGTSQGQKALNAAGLGFLGKVPLLGGAEQQAAKLGVSIGNWLSGRGFQGGLPGGNMSPAQAQAFLAHEGAAGMGSFQKQFGGQVSQAQIASMLRAAGFDPTAVMGVASNEGLSGGIGDKGHAFGPFQLNNAGGVLTGKFPGWTQQMLQAWAWSKQGIQWAIGQAIKSTASAGRGLTGAAAVTDWVKFFERPKNESADLAAGMAAIAGAPTTGPKIDIPSSLSGSSLFVGHKPKKPKKLSSLSAAGAQGIQDDLGRLGNEIQGAAILGPARTQLEAQVTALRDAVHKGLGSETVKGIRSDMADVRSALSLDKSAADVTEKSGKIAAEVRGLPKAMRENLAPEMARVRGDLSDITDAKSLKKAQDAYAAFSKDVGKDLSISKSVGGVNAQLDLMKREVGALPSSLRRLVAPQMTELRGLLSKVTDDKELAAAKNAYHAIAKEFQDDLASMKTAAANAKANLAKAFSDIGAAAGQVFDRAVQTKVDAMTTATQAAIDKLNADLQATNDQLDVAQQALTPTELALKNLQDAKAESQRQRAIGDATKQQADAKDKLAVATDAAKAAQDAYNAAALGGPLTAAKLAQQLADAQNKVSDATLKAAAAQAAYEKAQAASATGQKGVDLVTTKQKAVDAAQALIDANNNLVAAQNAQVETPDQTAARLVTLRQNLADSAQAVTDAQQGIQDATTAADDAAYAEQESALTDKATAERQALDESIQRQKQAASDKTQAQAQALSDQNKIEQQNYQDRANQQKAFFTTTLADLQTQLETRTTTWGDANQKILGLLASDFGLNPDWYTNGLSAGNQLLGGLASAFKAAAPTLEGYQAAAEAVNKVTGALPKQAASAADQALAIARKTEANTAAAAANTKAIKDAGPAVVTTHVTTSGGFASGANVNQVVRDALR